jgi:hypothetical protein
VRVPQQGGTVAEDRGVVEELARAGVGLAIAGVEVGFKVAQGALGALRNAGRR